MQYDRVIEQTLRDVRGILQVNLTPSHNLLDQRAVESLRAVMGAPQVGNALERGNAALCFVLRAVKHILSDKAQPPRAVLNRLWDALDEPELNRALGVKQNSRISVWRKKPPAR